MSKFTYITIVVILAGCLSPLIARQDQFPLIMQKSPDFGGDITPLEGVQMSGRYRLIEISATPRKGYEFQYWLGEVTDPTSTSTTVLLDSAKSVVAIFERSMLEKLGSSDMIRISGGGAASPGNPAPNRSVGYSRGLRSPAPAILPYYPPGNNIIIDDDDEQVPEPVSLILFAAGTLMLLKRKPGK
ncbi:MAG: PEP-CTERM sorting domain-containing protein [Planctomycetes bacterium]|nr:PEP-CTERM sorting domain-containing protein [Planctomycetota bacterium]